MSLIIFKSILFLYGLIVFLCLEYLVCPSKWRIELSVWQVVFVPVPRQVVHSFFSFLFDLFYNNINLAYVSITAWRRGFDIGLSFYLQKRVSLCSRYGFFCYAFTYFVLFRVNKNRVTKINLNDFNRIVTIQVALVNQFCFYMRKTKKYFTFE